MTSRVVAQINLAALQHNLRRVRAFAPHSSVLAMIKADAYGHGLLPVASALSQADGFGVARLEEAILLREQHPDIEIVVMGGFLNAQELLEMAAFSISTVVHSVEQVKLLASTHTTAKISVWLKINTGMSRLGFSIDAASEVYEQLLTCQQVKKPILLMTHFAQADNKNSDFTQKQIDSFFKKIHQDSPKSLANSAGIMAWPHSHADWVRPGIMLYGVSPFPKKTGLAFDLKPVMTLKTQLIAVHALNPGDAVGYGSTWVCSEKTRLGVAAIGYGDGYPRHARNATPVLVNGVRCELAGRVSMDLITIDLRHCPQAQIGDTVVLWGEGLPVEEVAACADTIAYELLCHVMPRVRFEYIQS